MGTEPAARVIESYAHLARMILANPPRLGHSRLVAVDGPSGAGKTLFAARLARALEAAIAGPVGPVGPVGSAGPVGGTCQVPVVHTDDLLDGWADQFTFWPRLRAWVLDPLGAGRPGRYRRYSWVRKRFTSGWVTVPAAAVVIVEGVSSARMDVADELTLAVFVTAPAMVRRSRSLVRDGPAMQPQLARWRLGEQQHFALDRTAARAHLIVDGTGAAPHDPDTEYVRLTTRRA